MRRMTTITPCSAAKARSYSVLDSIATLRSSHSLRSTCALYFVVHCIVLITAPTNVVNLDIFIYTVKSTFAHVHLWISLANQYLGDQYTTSASKKKRGRFCHPLNPMQPSLSFCRMTFNQRPASHETSYLKTCGDHIKMSKNPKKKLPPKKTSML